MDNKLTYIKERILYLISNKGFTRDDFFEKIGMTYGNFKGENKKRPINSDTIVNILSLIPDVNLKWLLTGEGAMTTGYTVEEFAPITSNEPDHNINDRNTPLVEYFEKKNTELQDKYEKKLEENAVLKHEISQLQSKLKQNADGAQGAAMAG